MQPATVQGPSSPQQTKGLDLLYCTKFDFSAFHGKDPADAMRKGKRNRTDGTLIESTVSSSGNAPNPLLLHEARQLLKPLVQLGVPLTQMIGGQVPSSVPVPAHGSMGSYREGVRYPSGLKEVDELLTLHQQNTFGRPQRTQLSGGGLTTGTVAELCGPPHSGKTHLAIHLVAVTLIDRVTMPPDPTFSGVTWITADSTNLQFLVSAVMNLLCDILSGIPVDMAEEAAAEGGLTPVAMDPPTPTAGNDTRRAELAVQRKAERCLKFLTIKQTGAINDLLGALHALDSSSPMIGGDGNDGLASADSHRLIVIDGLCGALAHSECDPNPIGMPNRQNLPSWALRNAIRRLVDHSQRVRNAVLLTTWGQIGWKAKSNDSRTIRPWGGVQLQGLSHILIGVTLTAATLGAQQDDAGEDHAWRFSCTRLAGGSPYTVHFQL